MIERLKLPPSDELQALLDYNPETGTLLWKSRPATSRVNKTFNAKFAGKEAGTFESWGYRQLRINKRLQMAHRVIWKLVTGEEPPGHLDHRDGDPSNNRWTNLRSATAETNAWNSKVRSNNTSGYSCIVPLKTKRPTSKKFRVRMSIGGKSQVIGDFHTLEQAKAAYEAAFAANRDVEFRR